MKVTGIDSLRRKLRAKVRQAEDASKASVVVGYSQRYAIYVHEDLTARHAEGKQAKYLEAPARRLGPTLGKLVNEVYAKQGSMIKALLFAGLRLLRESQLIVPIDTSALRASGYVAEESEAKAAASAAFQKSEAIRTGKTEKRRVKKFIRFLKSR